MWHKNNIVNEGSAMTTKVKKINIPVPKGLEQLVRKVVPAEAIVPTTNKARWSCCIVWQSHKNKAKLRGMLDRVGLRLRHEGKNGHGFRRDCRSNGQHTEWECCCDCNGCYSLDKPGYGFWHVAKKKGE
jgi:hypothetical protein